MAVFTEVPEDEAGALVRKLQLGELVLLRGIQGGIENTNYFLTVDNGDNKHDYVLTLKHELNAQAIAALSGESSKIQADVSKLIDDMNASIARADEFIKQMPK